MSATPSTSTANAPWPGYTTPPSAPARPPPQVAVVPAKRRRHKEPSGHANLYSRQIIADQASVGEWPSYVVQRGRGCPIPTRASSSESRPSRHHIPSQNLFRLLSSLLPTYCIYNTHASSFLPRGSQAEMPGYVRQRRNLMFPSSRRYHTPTSMGNLCLCVVNPFKNIITF
jgi:hypothetical protein